MNLSENSGLLASSLPLPPIALANQGLPMQFQPGASLLKLHHVEDVRDVEDWVVAMATTQAPGNSGSLLS